MSWKFPFIIVRPGAAEITTVYQASTLKDAQYWLRYIAEPGDALFQTPAHPKCSGQSEPKYMSHLEARGKTSTDFNGWSKKVTVSPMVIIPAA